MLLHDKCHKAIHKSESLLKKYEKGSIKSYKPNTFMSIINKRFYKDIPELEVTYGSITFVNRNKIGLKKTHYNDAFVVTGGDNQSRIKPYEIIQKHRNNRVLQLNRKGFKPSIKKKRSLIQPYDLFWVEGKNYVCKGMFNLGKNILYGSAKKKEYFSVTKVQRYFNYGIFSNSSRRRSSC